MPDGCLSAMSIATCSTSEPTSEHFFKPRSSLRTPQAEIIRAAKGGLAAAKAGRSRKHPMRADWLQARDDIMRRALHAKFTQHPALAELLLGTGDAVIVEHTGNDSYWGDGGDGSGRNRLGELLMELREQLRGEPRS